MNADNTIAGLSSLHEGFAGMALGYQILAFAGLIALTVLALTLVYYIVKGALYLAYYTVKGSLYLAYYSVKLPVMLTYYIIRWLISLAIFPFRTASAHQARQSATPQPAVKTIRIPKQQVSQPAAMHYCPDCGAAFTPVMESLFAQSHQCFCEACGHKAELVL